MAKYKVDEGVYDVFYRYYFKEGFVVKSWLIYYVIIFLNVIETLYSGRIKVGIYMFV